MKGLIQLNHNKQSKKAYNMIYFTKKLFSMSKIKI